MSYQITFLGTGTSTGIPMIGCHCSVCTSTDSRDKRLRTSIRIETPQGKSILIDTGPDLRAQLLQNNITKVDCALITHDHADHLHGIDDLRPLTFGKSAKEIPLFALQEHTEMIRPRFPYIFDSANHFGAEGPIGGGIPLLSLSSISPGQQSIAGEDFIFFKLPHGNQCTLGFYLAGMAYLIDCHEIPDKVVQILKSLPLKILIIDCLQEAEHRTHLSLQRCFHFIQLLRPKKAYLIHMGHDLGHEKLENIAHERFAHQVHVAYDGLKILLD